MPAVGMRRTTRIFGVVKRVEGARILRSGRRIWPDARETKLKRVTIKDDCYRIMRKAGNGHKPGVFEVDGPARRLAGYEPENTDGKETNQEESEYEEEEGHCVKKRRRVGIDVVYHRKRTRPDDQKRAALLGRAGDRKYGIMYYRKRRKTPLVSNGIVVGLAIAVVIEGTCRPVGFFESLLSSILRYMWTSKLSVFRLATFVLSQPICSVFSRQGILFLKDLPTNAKGICKFFTDRRLVPLFSVDFSAVPLFFMSKHQAQLLRDGLWSCAFVNKSASVLLNQETISVTEQRQPLEEPENFLETPGSIVHGKSTKDILQPSSTGATKLTGRSGQYRNGLMNPRSFRKRRSSLGRSRARHVSGIQRATTSSPSKFVGSRKNSKRTVSISPMVSHYRLRSSSRNKMFSKFSTSSTMESLEDRDPSMSCSANILVTEQDRCRREEGVTVTLELLSSGEWHLVAKKAGSIRYTHKAQMIMRPCSSNRVTHAIIWTGDDGWKLEFCSKQDWLTFKELHKECSSRNASTPVVKSIPVPGVSEVSTYGDHSMSNYQRPVSYISVKEDEISRALASRTAIYDIDAADEEWLKKFNMECAVGGNIQRDLSEDSFELMIDGFEKAIFCSDDFSEEKAISSLSHLGTREVLEAAYQYWMKKRKQRKTSLLRVFQGHHGKKDPVVLKPLLRKRRSFKRHANQHFGKGKQTFLLQAMAAERNALEELKLEEARVRSNSSLEAAVAKRQRAQTLMENADLATYKAMMAIRIAEAARMAESLESGAAELLDLDGT